MTDLNEDVVDFNAERERDYYYLRIEQEDGGRARSSPVWMERRGQ